MKTIPCSYKDCDQRRVHFSIPDETRSHRMVEVKDDHEGDAYCSLTCAIMDGKMSVKNEQPKHSPTCGWHKDWHDCNCGAFDKKSSKWYDCPKCDAGYEDQQCTCKESK